MDLELPRAGMTASHFHRGIDVSGAGQTSHTLFPAEFNLRKSLLQQLHGIKPALTPLIRQCVGLPLVNQQFALARMPASVVVASSFRCGCFGG